MHTCEKRHVGALAWAGVQAQTAAVTRVSREHVVPVAALSRPIPILSAARSVRASVDDLPLYRRPRRDARRKLSLKPVWSPRIQQTP